MKKIAIMGLVGILAGASQADTFSDATGENIFNGHLDLVSVEVVNDLTDLFFTINLSGAMPNDPGNNPTWGNFMVAIDSATGGSTGNAWNRPITHTTNPIEYWIGSWTDGGGGTQLWSYDGVAWNNVGAVNNFTYAVGSPTVTFDVPLASLGLSVGNTVNFDLYTTGTGNSDGAIDSLTNPNQTIADWGNTYEAATMSSYTVVPEPASLALLAVGGAMVAMFRRRKA